MSNWQYFGDVDICYGGNYADIDPQEFKWGYCNVVRVTDLDSACGFTGAVLIEKITVNIDSKRIKQALPCVGLTVKDLQGIKGQSAKLWALVDAVMSYGCFDTDESEVIQTQEGAPMTDDGWKAEKFIRPQDLRGYIEKTYLD